MPIRASSGFTLIELSIVLVIIGLIVGGVLVGQDLIRAAEIRATVAQYEKFNTAANTFRSKYNGLPGDLTNAANFGFFAETTLSGAVGHEDGNDQIEGGALGGTQAIGETIEFWRHLSDANLIDGTYGSIGNSAILPTLGLTVGVVTTMSQSLPPAKLGRGNYFIIYANSGLNYYQLLPITSINGPAGGTYTFGTTGITPTEAYAIDSKVDDGKPNTGVAVARWIGSANGVPTWAAASSPGTCVMNGTSATDTADLYNTIPATGANDPSCSVRLRSN